jgi:hypothetical protein
MGEKEAGEALVYEAREHAAVLASSSKSTGAR